MKKKKKSIDNSWFNNCVNTKKFVTQDTILYNTKHTHTNQT